MNCPQCQYLLFGLSEPRCPECGAGFSVTDFAFPYGAVHFLCPYCRLAYGGNDEFGLPRPRHFQCARCAKHVAAAAMIVRPVRDGVHGEPLRHGNAWEHREQIGVLRAFGRAAAQIALQPREFFRASYANDQGGALTFAIGCGYAATLLVALLLRVLHPLLGGSLPPGAGMRVFSVLFLMLVIIVVPVVLLVWTYLYAILIQLVLLITGTRSATFDDCVQAAAYACVVLPAMALPPVGLVWYAGLTAVGLEQMGGLSRGRSITAAVVPILICMSVVAGVVAYALLP